MSTKKQVRANFRNAVFKRDRFTCQVCGKKWGPEDTDPALNRVNALRMIDRLMRT